MAKEKLSARTVETLKTAGRYSDGGGLYLHVKATGSKSWAYIWIRDGKRREIGLGSFPKFSLEQARSERRKAEEAIKIGIDPVEILKPKAEVVIPTFGKLADEYIERKASEFRNAKHIAQWKVTLGTVPYDEAKIKVDPKAHKSHIKALTDLRGMSVDKIETLHVLAVLDPLWRVAPETASRLRGRIERVLNAAKSDKFRTGENPAAWRGNLDDKLPKRQKLSRGHHASMPFVEVPAFIEKLRKKDAISAKCLEFLILTATRTSEALGARWAEIDLEAGIWTIPADRMKAGKIHRVPLTIRALEIVKTLHKVKVSEFVFPGRDKKQLSNMSLAMLLRDISDGYTVHGMRSSFRTWAAETTNFPFDLCEAALAHAVGNDVSQAYQHGDLLAKRRKLMTAWTGYLEPKTGNVIPIKRA